MSRQAIEQRLSGSRRRDGVTPELHASVMGAVKREQAVADSWTAPSARRRSPWLIAAAGAAAAVVVAVVLIENSHTLAPPGNPQASGATLAAPTSTALIPAVGQWSALLETRLSQPLEKLQAGPVETPLATELAALTSDLSRLKPRLPWQAAAPPAG